MFAWRKMKFKNGNNNNRPAASVAKGNPTKPSCWLVFAEILHHLERIGSELSLHRHHYIVVHPNSRLALLIMSNVRELATTTTTTSTVLMLIPFIRFNIILLLACPVIRSKYTFAKSEKSKNLERKRTKKEINDDEADEDGKEQNITTTQHSTEQHRNGNRQRE